MRYLNLSKREIILGKIQQFFADITILEYDIESADIFAKQKAELKRKGMLIADMDLMIGCICIAKNIPLVTNNQKHFSRIKALKLVNWMN